MIIQMQNKFERKMDGDFPGGSVAKTLYSVLPMQGAWVQSLENWIPHAVTKDFTCLSE